MSRLLILSLLCCGLISCSSSPAGKDKTAAYLTDQGCSGFSEQQCAQQGEACQWIGVELCAPGPDSSCAPAGFCADVDPCQQHKTPESCEADQEGGCLWAALESLCPAGQDCPDGFCARGNQDDCVCACPVACTEGSDCPPCECDCAGCAVTGTVGCACPDCPDGESCSPCECEESGSGTISPDAPVPVPLDDLCLSLGDRESCLAASEAGCGWLPNPCPLGPDGITDLECPEFSCRQVIGGGDSGCTCVCPTCTEGEPCAPCACDCSGGGGTVECGEAEPGPIAVPPSGPVEPPLPE